MLRLEAHARAAQGICGEDVDEAWVEPERSAHSDAEHPQRVAVRDVGHGREHVIARTHDRRRRQRAPVEGEDHVVGIHVTSSVRAEVATATRAISQA